MSRLILASGETKAFTQCVIDDTNTMAVRKMVDRRTTESPLDGLASPVLQDYLLFSQRFGRILGTSSQNQRNELYRFRRKSCAQCAI